ncbi:Enteropeptidase [Oryzias melastigma]|uniref:Enteropeptidase n=1 Tax=Oryzias melastigma TaxID=30732 RepID=A0A834L3G8_ORYME|nr:Enteropeptidase [Oryzias melastigma]
MGSRISAAVVKPAMRRGAGLPRRRMQRWCDHRDMLMKNCNLSQQLKGHRRTATAPERDYPQLYNHRDCSDKFPHDFHESQSLLSGAFCSRLSFALPILTATRQLIQGFRSGAWPWMVSLHWRGRHACGASLISRDWLLTAAHCVYGKNTHLQYWSAVLGLHAQSAMNSQEVQIRQVDRIIINKKYDRRTKEADIAMMHLQQPVNFTEWVVPVCLAAEGQHFPAGRRCFIAGWGRDAEAGSLPDVLQEAEVPLVDQEECQRLLPEYTFTSSMLCAGYPEGGVDSCQVTHTWSNRSKQV